MMDALEKLELEYSRLADLAEQRRTDLSQAGDMLSKALDELIQAEGDIREQATTAYAELKMLYSVLGDELKEVTRRRDIAYLAQFELKEQEALDLAKALSDKVRTARLELDAAIRKARGYENGRRGTREEVTQAQAERAKLQAGYAFLVNDAERAGYALDKIRAEISEVKINLGL